MGFTNEEEGSDEKISEEEEEGSTDEEEGATDEEGATKEDATNEDATNEGGVIVVMVPVGETMCIFGGVYQFANGTAFLVACGKDNKVASA